LRHIFQTYIFFHIFVCFCCCIFSISYRHMYSAFYPFSFLSSIKLCVYLQRPPQFFRLFSPLLRFTLLLHIV
jgi:hypothetical protein